MCDYCSRILGGLAIKHTRLECQLRRSMYCPVCCSYGHKPADCPNRVALAIRCGREPDEENRVVELVDSDEEIRNYLKKNGLNTTYRSKAENKKLLHDFINSMNPPKMIVFRAATAEPSATTFL